MSRLDSKYIRICQYFVGEWVANRHIRRAGSFFCPEFNVPVRVRGRRSRRSRRKGRWTVIVRRRMVDCEEAYVGTWAVKHVLVAKHRASNIFMASCHTELFGRLEEKKIVINVYDGMGNTNSVTALTYIRNSWVGSNCTGHAYPPGT